MIVLANRLKSLQYEIVVIAKDRGVLRKLLYANVEVVDLGIEEFVLLVFPKTNFAGI